MWSSCMLTLVTYDILSLWTSLATYHWIRNHTSHNQNHFHDAFAKYFSNNNQIKIKRFYNLCQHKWTVKENLPIIPCLFLKLLYHLISNWHLLQIYLTSDKGDTNYKIWRLWRNQLAHAISKSKHIVKYTGNYSAPHRSNVSFTLRVT